MRFRRLAPLTLSPPPGSGRIRLPDTPGALGFTDATSNVAWAGAACPKTQKAELMQRIASFDVLLNPSHRNLPAYTFSGTTNGLRYSRRNILLASASPFTV